LIAESESVELHRRLEGFGLRIVKQSESPFIVALRHAIHGVSGVPIEISERSCPCQLRDLKR
jgi:hypothetical protein